MYPLAGYKVFLDSQFKGSFRLVEICYELTVEIILTHNFTLQWSIVYIISRL